MKETSPSGQDKGLRNIVFWCMYDWGNSAFPAIVLSFVFAPYFLNQVATETTLGEAQWGLAISASAVIIAILSPFFGALADRSGRRRPWLGGSSLVAILATAAMWYVAPGQEALLLALVLLVVANAGFELAYVFYNALLPNVAPNRLVGRVSGFGWGAGYLGSLTALGLVLFLFIYPDPALFGLDRSQSEHLRMTPVFTAVWFLLFALPIVALGPKETSTSEAIVPLLRNGLRDLWATLRSLRSSPSIAWFLLAHMLFIDGVNTLFVFGPLIAVGLFGFTEAETLLFGVSIYLAAGAGAFCFGILDDRLGAKPVLIGSIVAMIMIALCLILVDSKVLFWAFAALLGVFFGPLQSSSRSLMVRLSPPDRRTKLFGIYALAGRATAPLGPAAVSWAILWSNNQRAGIVVVIGLLLFGAMFLVPVKEPKEAILANCD